MRRIITLLIAAVIALSACAKSADDASNKNQTSLTTPETQNEERESNLPEDYDGKTEFVIGNQTILSINDSKNIFELYPGNSEDGTPTIFQVEYDSAWVRETSGLSFNSIESPTFFDIPNREYKGFYLDTQKMYYQKVTAGDTYKGYTVKEAKTAFESLGGNVVLTKVTFEGDIALRGTLIFSSDDMISFLPFAQGNDFLPILENGLSITWSDEYAQIDDNGMGYIVTESIDGSVLTTLKEKKKLDVELSITELTLMENEFATCGNLCKIKSIKVI